MPSVSRSAMGFIGEMASATCLWLQLTPTRDKNAGPRRKAVRHLESSEEGSKSFSSLLHNVLNSLTFWAQIAKTSSSNTCFGYQINVGQETLVKRNPPKCKRPICQHQRLTVLFCFTKWKKNLPRGEHTFLK